MKKIWFLFLFVVVLMFILICVYGLPWRYLKAKNEFTLYLEDKYHQDPVIEKMHYSLLQKSYKGTVHFKKSPDVHFTVKPNSLTGFIEDNYVKQIPVSEVKKDLLPILNRVFPLRIKETITVIDKEKNIVRISLLLPKNPSEQDRLLLRSAVVDKGYQLQLVIDVEKD